MKDSAIRADETTGLVAGGGVRLGARGSMPRQSVPQRQASQSQERHETQPWPADCPLQLIARSLGVLVAPESAPRDGHRYAQRDGSVGAGTLGLDAFVAQECQG